jgi:beta-RFAP synthase
VERGARSGIGLGAFQQGGVLLDGGRGDSDDPPPVIARAEFPEDWRLILVMHHDMRGLHGTAELEAFRRLPPFPAEKAAHLCRLMLMVGLPALAEHDVRRFGEVIGELQRVVGDHFAPAQGGRFTSPLVAEAVGWLEGQGVPGVGQSSWGPTGFAICGSEEEAEGLADAARRRWADAPLNFLVCRGSNTGARIESIDLAAAPG